ncbi:hypothetical protein MRB53_024390 [Persea americana]|uniref:Uncharacterized protein n=1 Tax=Persea americana TaxID=3435 RepID=A0ACC2LD74_PERAE|nr:hypothetical protein MRB53_024390 [Persea americana]
MEGGRRRKIMVALEDNDMGIYALDWALNYLIPPASDSTEPDHFVILYVQPPGLSNTPLVNEEEIFQGQALSTMEKSRRCIEHVNDTCKKHNITYEMKVMVGEANMVICEAAKTLCVDLLVVGNHEYGGLKRIFSSSKTTGGYCVQHAKCPVVVVKRRQRTL